MRALVIESDRAAADSLKVMLGSEGIDVILTGLGQEGIGLAKQNDDYDVIVMEKELGDGDGIGVLQQLRRDGVHTPVIFLATDALVSTKVEALKFGADDYMTKPFAKDELVARITAVVRRHKGYSGRVVKVGVLSIDLDDRTVKAGGRYIHVSPAQFKPLELLALRCGNPVSSEALRAHIYGVGNSIGKNTLVTLICRLRAALMVGADGVNYIQPITNGGYMLAVPQD